MSARRVVITGIGAVTPIGTGAEGLWAGVLADRSAVRADRPIRRLPFPSRIAAQIDDFDPAATSTPGAPAGSTGSARCQRDRRPPGASSDAGLPLDEGCAARTGVWIGSALGGVAYGEEQHAGYVARGARGVSPTLALAVFGGAGASNVALDLGLTGPSVGNANSCASGAMAIGQAFHAIRDGTVDARPRRRGRGAAGAADVRCLRPHPRPLHPQRRPRGRVPALRPSIATGS